MNVWTFGHSTRTSEETIALLRHHRVERVVDVRTCASSKHCPQHNGTRMQAWLAQAKIDYAHLPDLGGHRGTQPDVDPAINAGWSKAPFHHYADWTLNPAYDHALDELARLAAEKRTAYMCSEAVPWRCHRTLISTSLTARGWTVHHILSDATPKIHALDGWGATPAIHDGQVTYPANAREDRAEPETRRLTRPPSTARRTDSLSEANAA